MQVIDCHGHLNDYDQINKSERKFLSLQETLTALIQCMHDNSIDYSIILSSYKVDADRPSTSDIIDVANKYDNELGVKLQIMAQRWHY